MSNIWLVQGKVAKRTTKKKLVMSIRLTIISIAEIPIGQKQKDNTVCGDNYTH